MEDLFKLIIGLFVLMCVFDSDRRIKSLEKQVMAIREKLGARTDEEKAIDNLGSEATPEERKFFEDQFKSWHDR